MLKINYKPISKSKISSGVIRIISSFSNFGGSTILFIDLCRLFNDNGMPAVFYGPNPWHLGMYRHCLPSANFEIYPDDYLIGHMTDLNKSPFRGGKKLVKSIFAPCRARVLSIHEKTGHTLNPTALKHYEKIVFASKSQQEWHGYYKGPQQQLIIPTAMANLHRITKTHPNAVGVAGVIGSLAKRKQTHISILRALKDGCKKVLLFGRKHDEYFDDCVAPLLSDRVVYMGEIHMDKKQQMYEMISCVYHSSTEEIACLVQGECEMVGIPFHTDCNTVPYEMWPSMKIIEAWKNTLNYVG